MVVHRFQLRPAELVGLLASDMQVFRCPWTIHPVKFLTEQILLAAAETVAPLALVLDIFLVPPRRHACSAHEVAGIDFGPMSDRRTGETRSMPRIVNGT